MQTSMIMALTRIDDIIGRILFIPIILKICQFTHSDQHVVSRALWVIAGLDLLLLADSAVETLLGILFSAFMSGMLWFAVCSNLKTFSVLWFRGIGLLLLFVDGLVGFRTGQWAGSEFWLIVLFAEYAATIRTVPPTSHCIK